MTNRVERNLRKLLLIAVAWTALAGPTVIAQISATPTAKPLAFDVVSIRPSGSGRPPNIQILPDGFQAIHMLLTQSILMAYFPPPFYQYYDQLKGVPAWVRSEPFDIEAKVAPADLAEWQKQKPSMVKNSEMMQAMLQNALAERCKLVVHRIPTEIQGYELGVGKQGPKLKQAKPDEVLPPGMQLPDGGTAVGSASGAPQQWTFYGASMESLREFLSLRATSILDKTGLSGRYDFVLMKREDYVPPEGPPVNPDPAEFYDMGAIGLELKPVKVPSENVVIDHIERPSEN